MGNEEKVGEKSDDRKKSNNQAKRPEHTSKTNIDPKIENLEQLFIQLINSLLQKEGGNKIMAEALLQDESEELFKIKILFAQ